MSQQTDFNDKVLALLDMLVERVDPFPTGRRSEPKHDIVGTPLHDLLHEVEMSKPETQ